VHDIKDAKQDLNKINKILAENYGKYETGFLRIGGNLGEWSLDPGSNLGVKLEVQAAAVGQIQNPVVPELLAGALAVGLVDIGWTKSLDKKNLLRLNIVGGAGIERRLSAVSTDLVEKLPFQKEGVTLFGFDLFYRHKISFASSNLFLAGSTEETVYKGLGGTTSSTLDRKLRRITHEPQLRADYIYSIFGAHAILGTHPLPEKILPRVWNRAANSNWNRELGAMSGAGISAVQKFGKHSLIGSMGLYAGYLGGEIKWHMGRSEVKIMSYEIENSSAYKTLGRRTYSAAADIYF
jgi:hypothetical protein